MGQIIATLSEMHSGQVKVPLDTLTTIIVVPDAVQCEIVGKLFDPGKTFLWLDRAVEELRYVHRLAARLASGKDVLIVVHTDPLRDAGKSEQLSRDRAAMVSAWFEGDVQTWLDNYADSVPKQERWGAREDHRMLAALGDFGAVSEDERPKNADPRYDALVRGFQRSRGFTDDGIAGPVTRKQLVQEYFALAQVTDEFVPVPPRGEAVKANVNLAQHGAGPHFSIADAESKRQAALSAAKSQSAESSKNASSSGGASNGAPPNNADADTSSPPQPAEHARLDFFFFFNQDGMDPAPGNADGEEFLEWVALAAGGHKRFRITALDTEGKGYLQLLDKTERAMHAQCPYRLSGPEVLEGLTDSRGIVSVAGLLVGDYILELERTFFAGTDDEFTDRYQTSLVVLPTERTMPQVRLLGAVPRVELARLRGLLFDTNKAFLLPSALEDLKTIRMLYEQHNPGKLLVVGHTDTTGDASINDPLSLERAEAMLAYLRDDVAGWEKFYGSSIPESRRWGATEDQHLLGAVLAKEEQALPHTDGIKAFQRRSELQDDGIVGPKTRKALIAAYMALDGAQLDTEALRIEATAHGCGQNFPLDDSGAALEEDAKEEKADAQDRRVELFFFDAEFGIVPKPNGKNSKAGSREYPRWRDAAERIHDGVLTERDLRHVEVVLRDQRRAVIADAEVDLQAPGWSESARTDANGLLSFDVPRRIVEVSLCVAQDTHVLRFQELDPLPSVRGVQSRLLALGYDSGPLTGKLGGTTVAAIRAFQRDQKLRVDGVAGPKTCAALRAAFGT